MFWNTDYFNASPSHIDVLLQSQDTKLPDILFEEDILQEIKTSNINLTNFLIKPEIINELVDFITQLTENDCCAKHLYSRVHAAYISCEILTACSQEIFDALLQHPDSLNKIISSLTRHRVVPQKATLICKLISNIHSQAPADLSCHITKNLEIFSELIEVLIQNIDISGSFEILSTLINRTNPSELRYVFCEILSKLNFVDSLINLVTSSNLEDKQRNACQLLCDIIVIGRQEASEQAIDAPSAQDMLAENIESREAVHKILTRIFSHNTTSIVCGMKILQTLIEQKASGNNNNNHHTDNSVARTIERIQDEIVNSLSHFHELLLNPPKQEPIKTTFGIIQKPLGYMRLEVVNLIRALLSTNSSVIIKELVRLNTMKVVIDLFIEYSWNNLLHTQVEQALCIIIKNCRYDEDLKYQIDMQKHTTNNIHNHHQNHDDHSCELSENNNEIGTAKESPLVDATASIDSTTTEASSSIKLNNVAPGEPASNDIKLETSTAIKAEAPNNVTSDVPTTNHVAEERSATNNVTPETPSTDSSALEEPKLDNLPIENSTSNSTTPETLTTNNVIVSSITQETPALNHTTNSERVPSDNAIIEVQTTNDETPSRALLSQLLNECDLIGRLLLPCRNGEQANFGHIIQMINSIAINCDLDTIKDHLNEMKEKRPELHSRWTTFVNVDVASFKEISYYFDVSSVNNHIDDRDKLRNQSISHSQQNHFMTSSNRNNQLTHNSNANSQYPSTNNENNFKSADGRGGASVSDDDKIFAYLSFTSETVLPSINVDVLPKSRQRSAKNNNY